MLASFQVSAFPVAYHPTIVHGRAVMYHERIVERVEYYMRGHKFRCGPMRYFISSCVWLKKYSAYDYCNSSDGRITIQIMKNNGMAADVARYYSSK